MKLSNQQLIKNNQDNAQFPPKNKQGSKGKTIQMCVREEFILPPSHIVGPLFHFEMSQNIIIFEKSMDTIDNFPRPYFILKSQYPPFARV